MRFCATPMEALWCLLLLLHTHLVAAGGEPQAVLISDVVNTNTPINTPVTTSQAVIPTSWAQKPDGKPEHSEPNPRVICSGCVEGGCQLGCGRHHPDNITVIASEMAFMSNSATLDQIDLVAEPTQQHNDKKHHPEPTAGVACIGCVEGGCQKDCHRAKDTGFEKELINHLPPDQMPAPTISAQHQNEFDNESHPTFRTACSGCWAGCQMGCRVTNQPPPLTVTKAPLRTTLVRTVLQADVTAAAALPDTEDSQSKAAEAVSNRGEDAKQGEEITETYYEPALSGFDGTALLLTTQDSAHKQVTLLAQLNTTLFSSFISSTLVEELGLTRSIRSASKAPSYLPERDLTSLFGYDTYPLGVLSIDALVGKDDRLMAGMETTVFHAPSGKGTDGRWQPDLVVGMEFLNRAEAVRLTDEYIGGVQAGARDGAEVVVQRVFWEEGSKAEMRLHDEL